MSPERPWLSCGWSVWSLGWTCRVAYSAVSLWGWSGALVGAVWWSMRWHRSCLVFAD
ncbi:MAG: hypothetical protein ACK56F_13165 [bacterium]